MYKEIVQPFLENKDSETWHNIARNLLHLAETNPIALNALELFAYKHRRYSNERLNVIVAGINFDNVVMVGAGRDKNGVDVRALYKLGACGVEVGTATPLPQPGNEKPRQFMITRKVCLNGLGYNNDGAEKIAKNLQKYKDSGIPIGISVGRNKKTENDFAYHDYQIATEKLEQYASFISAGLSTPNSPGLRELQKKKYLPQIIQVMKEKTKKKIFLKIAPDLTLPELDDIIQVAVDEDLGIIATNTTNNPDIKGKYGDKWRKTPGGLSGDDPDFRNMATEIIKHIYRITNGQIEIIGAGGITDTNTALEKMLAGARIVQVITALRIEGPAVFGKINRGLVKWMDENGVNNISQIVGQNVRP